MEEWYKRWLESDKLKQLQKMKEEDRIKNELRMSKNQLLEVIDSLMSYHRQPLKDKEVSDWLMYDKDKQSIIDGHYSSCIKWCFYLKQFELFEDYQMCILIRDLLVQEANEAKRFCSTYFAYSDDDDKLIDECAIDARSFIDEEYNIHINK